MTDEIAGADGGEQDPVDAGEFAGDGFFGVGEDRTVKVFRDGVVGVGSQEAGLSLSGFGNVDKGGRGGCEGFGAVAGATYGAEGDSGLAAKDDLIIVPKVASG